MWTAQANTEQKGQVHELCPNQQDLISAGWGPWLQGKKCTQRKGSEK